MNNIDDETTETTHPEPLKLPAIDRYGWREIIVKYFSQPEFQYHVPSPQRKLSLPNTEIAKKTYEHAKLKIDPMTMNHSIRIFLYMRAVIYDYFPDWNIDEEVLYVVALLHYSQIEALRERESKMTAALLTGVEAYEFMLRVTHGNKEYAGAICEAICRQQATFEGKGYTTSLCFILQTTVMIDCVGDYNFSRLIHPETLHWINTQYPRKGWMKCLNTALALEFYGKPWGLSSTLEEGFLDRFKVNKLAYTHDELDDGDSE
ncbi:hypothetical protein WICPIJ_009325 [Wickerhamomyces pijperi]|uniref:Uncharacterized protein n=1 Tax=Wickerhamomyces pijperi TaxID=599730 RepID=A0A9P8PQ23_WICPI|nr:hypothetical protein WICPIJ_009325 [Wickerhamomyces pijperi]